MGISIWQLLIVLVIVLLLFGTKRLRHLGSDLGTAIKGFRSAVSDGDKNENSSASEMPEQDNDNTIEGEVISKDEKK